MHWHEFTGCQEKNDKYQNDCLVRYLLEHGYQGAINLGWPGGEIIIEAGIGKLILSEKEKIWTPTITGKPPPAPLPAAPALVAQRLATCHACDRWTGNSCSVAGCGCSGHGMAERKFAKCPIGKWLA